MGIQNKVKLSATVAETNVLSFDLRIQESEELSFSVLDYDEQKQTRAPSRCSIKSKNKKNLRLSFSAVNEVHDIDTYDASQKQDIWYTTAELAEIEKTDTEIARLMKKGYIVEGNEHTCRGLEDLADVKRRKDCYQRAELSRQAVLIEQYCQTEGHISDPHAIATVYKRSGAVQSCDEAFAMGLSDYVQLMNFDRF